MKISLNWIKEFTDVKVGIDELVAKIGAQLGEVEEVINLGERYEGIVVAKVVSCEKHPNADKLKVCKIYDGKAVKGVKRDESGYVQVVCGAPNVRAGIAVAWIPPGAIVPSSFDAEQFTLESRELRGVVSNGMLASGKELAINDDHDGILEVDLPTNPGESFAELYKLDDYIIDVENKMFTHRPDCFGQLGVAREIAGISGVKFKTPDWYLQTSLDLPTSESQKLDFSITNELPELVSRYMLAPITGIKVQKSPIIMQSFLSRVGVKPINNVVDATNTVMCLTAQPLHAFDYDKILALDKSSSANISLRKPKSSETIALLSGKTIKPHPDTIMIASKSHLIAVGGIMGGSQTEVDFDTKNILLECANFDMYSIRRSSMANGLFTDAVTRLNKGQSSFTQDKVLAFTVLWINKLSGGVLAGDIKESKSEVKSNQAVEISADFINLRLGSTFTAEQIATILQNVEFDIKTLKDKLEVKAPFWRTDIQIPEDIVEEVGRLYGYDKLPIQLPSRSTAPTPTSSLLKTKELIRSIMSSAGANEVLSYSFVHGNLIKSSGQNIKEAYQLSNALSPNLQYYRLSLIPSLLEKVHPNIKAGFEQFALYEINKFHSKESIDDAKLPIENESVALIFAADKKTQNNYHGSAFYQALAYMNSLLDNFGITGVELAKFTSKMANQPFLRQAIAPLDTNRSALVLSKTGSVMGVIGEIKPNIKKDLKLPEFVAGFELNIKELINEMAKISYQPLGRFPGTHQDISLKLKNDITHKEVLVLLNDVLRKTAKIHGYNYNVETKDIYQKDELFKNLTFRITLSHPDRTLVTKEVNTLLDEIAVTAKSDLNAVRL